MIDVWVIKIFVFVVVILIVFILGWIFVVVWYVDGFGVVVFVLGCVGWINGSLLVFEMMV